MTHPVAADDPAGPEAGVAPPGPPAETGRAVVPVRTILAAIGLVSGHGAGAAPDPRHSAGPHLDHHRGLLRRRRIPGCQLDRAAPALVPPLARDPGGVPAACAADRRGDHAICRAAGPAGNLPGPPAAHADRRCSRRPGPVGRLLDRTHVLTYIQQNDGKIRSFAGTWGPGVGVLKTAATWRRRHDHHLRAVIPDGRRRAETGQRQAFSLFPDDRAQHIRAVGT